MGPNYREKLIEWVPLVREGQTVPPKLRLEGLEAAPGAYMVPRRLLGPHVPCMPMVPAQATHTSVMLPKGNTGVVRASGWGLAWPGGK